MFRMWGKIFKDNNMTNSFIAESSEPDTRTHKVFKALTAICYAFDLAEPIWLDKNIREFKKHSKTRFSKDSFIESISFDYLEIEIIEEEASYL